ncbi:MAG: DUF2306 domain-containing protein [Terriglobales bacterium]
MDPWISAIRWVHIAAGFAAFFIAPVPLLTAKGGKTHRRWGKIYFWSMAVVALTAVVLAFYRPVIFLALIAVFSFYFAFTGYRVLSRKRPAQGQGPKTLDWAAALLALAGSLALVGLGVFHALGTVAVVFGALGCLIAGRDLWQFLRPPADGNFWWFVHMGGMVGSYIAALSAFSVVNFEFLPTLVRWLWPTAIGVPLLLIWIGYYRHKFTGRQAVSQAGA